MDVAVDDNDYFYTISHASHHFELLRLSPDGRKAKVTGAAV